MKFPWSRKLSSPPGYYNDLLCRSGFGDRITDLWGAMTVCRLRDPNAPILISWTRQGDRFEGFHGIYALELFEIDGCQFIDAMPPKAVKFKKKGFSDRRLPNHCIVPLGPGQTQVVLHSCFEWGNSCPDRLHRDAEHYGFAGPVSLDDFVRVYRDVGRGTRPTALVADAIPCDIADRVGIHVRRMDKLVETENTFEMSHATWKRIEAEGHRQVDVCIANGEPMFVCSDDIPYRNELVKLIRDRDGDVIVADLPEHHAAYDGYGALLDFFALSRCRRVLQMTKYSTFSIAAAIVGGIPLVNLHPSDAVIQSRIENWHSVLA